MFKICPAIQGIEMLSQKRMDEIASKFPAKNGTENLYDIIRRTYPQFGREQIKKALHAYLYGMPADIIVTTILGVTNLPMVVEYGSDLETNNRSVRTVLNEGKTKQGRLLQFIHKTAGYEPAGSCARLTNKSYGVIWYVDGVMFGQWHKTMDAATRDFYDRNVEGKDDDHQTAQGDDN